MKRLQTGLLVTAMTLGAVGTPSKAEAGDREWAVAGKILAGIMVLDAIASPRRAPAVYHQPMVYHQPVAYRQPVAYAPPVVRYAPVARSYSPPRPTPRQVFRAGYQQGYTDGRQDGFQQGRQVGFRQGTRVGYQVGAQDGYRTGVRTGFQRGVQHASYGWSW